MRRWWRRLIARADQYYDRDWKVVWFQPILYLFLFGAVLRLIDLPGPSLSFEKLNLLSEFYVGWLAMGLLCPSLALGSAIMIHRGGRLRVLGFGTRLAADVGVFTFLLAYHLAVVLTNPANESRIVSRYVVAAVMLFVLELIVRDIWAIRINEKRTARLRP